MCSSASTTVHNYVLSFVFVLEGWKAGRLCIKLYSRGLIRVLVGCILGAVVGAHVQQRLNSGLQPRAAARAPQLSQRLFGRAQLAVEVVQRTAVLPCSR